jgi:HD-like signal output (HDOD) protein
MTIPPTEQDAGHAARHAQTVICLSKLPPFHPAALRLLNIASESGTAMEDFETNFRGDPALTADLLLVANSPLFGTRANIASIRHALTHLGLERVRSLASTIALSFFVRNQPRTAFVRQVWGHSIATATIAEVLGRVYRSSDMYTAGLMHDLGRLGMLLTVGQNYETWVSAAVPNIEDSMQLEWANFGMNHCEAGSMVGQKWGFPTVLQNCMVAHHALDTGRQGGPIHLVQLACRMAGAIGFPEVYHEPEPFPELPDGARACQDLSIDRLRERVMAQIETIGR